MPGIPPLRGLLSKMTMTGCRDLFAEFSAEPTAARNAVPVPFVVRICSDGKALLLLMVQECESCVLNGLLAVRPMNMAHFWIELAGPEEVGPGVPWDQCLSAEGLLLCYAPSDG
jgi:hypothetical protein